MKQFLLFTLLGLSLIYGITSLVITVWPKSSALPVETARLIKEVP